MALYEAASIAGIEAQSPRQGHAHHNYVTPNVAPICPQHQKSQATPQRVQTRTPRSKSQTGQAFLGFYTGARRVDIRCLENGPTVGSGMQQN